ncbi:hypothetical protein GCM10012284_59480 [Mangrovihabitans endophyticus]|uniref:PAS domain S-box-containing protein/diguanylate cyclase (GGDEF) domain-containing protein n=1 Tax=Mangrovihabitans endophyticus TaxID=1751298 RepID=A0A8J3FSF8_9ACTN|nr:hypothetical protein GCM10012284_59480 [Mangrovihabitans endophyticus]
MPGRMRKNSTGVIVDVDDLVLDVLGFTRDEMVGYRSTEFIHPEDHEQAFASWIRLLNDPGVGYTVQVRHRTGSGGWLWLESTNTADPADPTSVHTEMVLIDRPMDDRTSVSSHLLRRLAEALPFGIAQIDSERRVHYRNGRLDDVTGCRDGEQLADVMRAVADTDQPTLEKAVAAVLDGEDSEIEVTLHHPVRGTRRCGVILSALAGRSGYGTTGALLCVTDVTDQVQERDDIMRRAKQDGLTGCLNRVAVTEALHAAVATGAGVATIFIDLDRFKEINDTYGHAAGDRLLTCVGERLRRNSRNCDVGRLGGDEFLVVARDVTTQEQAEQLGRRLARAVRRPVNLGGTPVRPGASVGVAWSADPAVDPDALVTRADEAMYAAKRTRRTRSGVS